MRMLAGRGRTRTPPIEQVARVTRRLAVLLAAGVPPGSAWGYLTDTDDRSTDATGIAGATGVPERAKVAEFTRDSRGTAALRRTNGSNTRGATDTGPDAVVHAVVVAHADGLSIPDALIAASANAQIGSAAQSAWRSLATAWSVAAEAGAPLADCLHRLADSFDDHGSRQRELEVALAGPAATARMVMWLPVVGVLFGVGLGFDTLGVLFGSVPGVLFLVLGGLLMLLGGRWNRAMIRAAGRQQASPGLIIELTAIAMAGGGSVDRARTLATDAARRFLWTTDTAREPTRSTSVRGPLTREQAARVPTARTETAREQANHEHSVVDRVLALATRAGVPAAGLLRAEAAQVRRQAKFDGQKAVAAVAVRLMIPLGLCILPAFMLLGVAPLLMAVLSSTIAEF